MEDSSNKSFLNVIILLSRLSVNLKDKFFSQKLYGKILSISNAYFDWIKIGDSPDTSVAQYKISRLLSFINETIELIDYLDYLKIAESSPLSLSRKYLLEFKLEFLKIKKNIEEESSKPENETEPPVENVESDKSGKPVFNRKIELNANEEKILDYIKQSPNIRVKEIVDEFSVLSERTVKRSLKELVNVGLLKKRTENKTIYYYVVNAS